VVINSAINKTKGASVGILVMQKNILGEWEVDNDKSVYTSIDSINSKVGGLDTLVHDFAFAVRAVGKRNRYVSYKSVIPFYGTAERYKFSRDSRYQEII